MQVHVEIPVEVFVEKRIEIPIPVERFVDKIVEKVVTKEVPIEKIVRVEVSSPIIQLTVSHCGSIVIILRSGAGYRGKARLQGGQQLAKKNFSPLKLSLL